MIAVYAGSFSPPTKGHLDIIRRAAGAAMILYGLYLIISSLL